MVEGIMGPLKFVTAASLFDGHDVSINIIRRMLQDKGVEVVHLGHNRSAQEIVKAVVEEDAHAVAISSYQGGHNEFFSYIRSLLDELGAKKVKIFGGGGGVITPKEIESLEKNGIEKIYSPADGMNIGLEGIIDDMIKRSSYDTLSSFDELKLDSKVHFNSLEIGKILSWIETNLEIPLFLKNNKKSRNQKEPLVLGITGTGGAGKSSLIDELVIRFLEVYPQKRISLVSIDPSKKSTKGALLGDRIRMGQIDNPRIYFRSQATRNSSNELSPTTKLTIDFLKTQDFHLIIVETSGIGQASDAINEVADFSLYVMTPEYGAQTQLEKIEMLGSADFVAINKFDKSRGRDALRDVRKQYRRNKKSFDLSISDEMLPIYGTVASQFNDKGVNALFYDLAITLGLDRNSSLEKLIRSKEPESISLLRPERSNYLFEISETVKNYNKKTDELCETLNQLQSLELTKKLLKETKEIDCEIEKLKNNIPSAEMDAYFEFENKVAAIKNNAKNYSVSLSEISIPKVALPHFKNLSDRFYFMKMQNIPGEFPFASGVFSFKRSDELPKRQFAGEGGPIRTNQRFHFLCQNDSAKRLSTAFDSVTLYGEDPDIRPDIYGKIGESGVSICTVEDMSDLYKGFDLTDVSTSVSKTINGPASIILAMFMNAAFRQKYSEEYWDDKEKLIEVMKQVRGTVQADILKEDQAQNTCIFSLNFSLKLMGDVQEFFSKNKIKNYYTVSVSGYHIAEAGANPITQVAFTLANGFTYLEYYLYRGMDIDDICSNISFFFSNGLDAEYSVIGRVARKIWAVALRDRYHASPKSQRLKYHIQTSGRSLHAQEMAFNDIRTTLQALLALGDNCNSLHTNAYDEAITTPTEESVRRAMAIQLIIVREFGLMKTDNCFQGSFIFDELADLVEAAILNEFEKISQRGGVLGAMEAMYQRSKIQDESMHYELLKDEGKIPIIGVNTYVSPDINERLNVDVKLSRASYEEKNEQIKRLKKFKEKNSKKSEEALKKLKKVVLSEGNVFEELLDTVKYCSLGQITSSLNEVGGRYRRGI